MQPDFCWWCDAPVKVPTPHDYKAVKVFCSRQCMTSNWMFNQLYKKGVIHEVKQSSADGKKET